MDLVKRFNQMRDMMSQLGSGGGLLSRMPGMGKLASAGGIDPSELLGAGGSRAAPMRSQKNESQKKRKRKQARKARRKGRRR